jgi:hypothetical protein
MTAIATTPVLSAFLLIQSGKILDIATAPHRVGTHLVTKGVDWQIYAGCLNEFGKAEIVGPVARVWVGENSHTVRCYIEQGGKREPANPDKAPGNLGFFVRSKLFRLLKQERINDPVNYAQCKVFVC